MKTYGSAVWQGGIKDGRVPSPPGAVRLRPTPTGSRAALKASPVPIPRS